MVKFWLKNILPIYKNIFKPINPNKIVKGIENIEKEICGRNKFENIIYQDCFTNIMVEMEIERHTHER